MSDMRYINRKVLEALKPMGRIDGDMPVAGANESTTIEAWRRECERLRGWITQLEDERDGLKRGIEALRVANVHWEKEARGLQAQSGDTTADENEALRIIIRHLAKIL